MIEVQSLTRLYGKNAAVDDVSFTIGNHEIVGLLGHNGAGKTTIMKMLSGYLEPTRGSIIIDGINLSNDARSAQNHLGYLPENLPIYPEMMVADYLDYVATLKGIPAAKRLGAVREVLSATDLTQRALDPINILSRGYKQRVGVAQAILGEPNLLILDEPTNGLDPNQTEHMRQLIRRLARRTTIILSTHIMQEVDAVCGRVLMLRNGRLALDQNLADLHNSKTLMLRTSAGVPSLTDYLEQLADVESLQSFIAADGLMHFDIHLNPSADIDTAANSVAQCVIQAGAELYQLQVSAHDLDQVFREVYDNGN
jgi:ABC-2 type transport system ATP-binding protein